MGSNERVPTLTLPGRLPPRYSPSALLGEGSPWGALHVGAPLRGSPGGSPGSAGASPEGLSR
eukprot:12234994-Alexandrium_andersonii.AAC.1